jgi:hypothetical protein
VTERAGKILFVCRSGCRQDEVLEGLRQRGLWAAGPAHPRTRERPSPLLEARHAILASARRERWASEGTQLLYRISDWIRCIRRKASDLRRFGAHLAIRHPGDLEACSQVLVRAAHLETFVHSIEAELDELLAGGGRW